MLLIDLITLPRFESGKYYVYVFVAEETEYYKIGYTNHVFKRLSTVNSASPQIVACVKYYTFEEKLTARNFEKYMHRVYAGQRLRNRLTGELKEWFLLKINQVEQIDQHYKAFLKLLAREKIPVNNRLSSALHHSQNPEIKELPDIPKTPFIPAIRKEINIERAIGSPNSFIS
jgi:hypothetical protein